MLALGDAGATAQGRSKVVDLPIGFQPEGIAARNANTFFVGSIPTGAIYRGNLKTGEGSIFVPAQEGRSAIGLSMRRGVLFVAGGATGQAYVYDARTGASGGCSNSPLRKPSSTTSSRPRRPPTSPIPSTGFSTRSPRHRQRAVRHSRGDTTERDLVYEEGFNTNGIDATRNGKKLVVVQSNTGRLFTVDPRSGVAQSIDLGGETVTNGDGILLDGGRRLWVLQNRDNWLTLVRLKPSLGSGKVVERFTDETFDVPTTLARAGNRLALVSARFGTTSPETAEYWVTQIRRPR
ncbi:MAG: superoxide dismutase [Actinobacteria bacterium]|nr:superoxide dismutase [Actinomycetota bacterium]